MNAELIYTRELQLLDPFELSRRFDFLELMSWNLYNPRADWQLFWNLFYKSDVSAEEAYELSVK